MCGIYGIIYKNKSDSFGENFLSDLSDQQRHRGPDDTGRASFTHNDWNIYIGHRRLAIIDVENNQQPINHSNHIFSYNGEIYNYKELDSYQSGFNDTETLFNGYRKQGIELLEKLDGMFAFSYYSKKENTLELIRDYFGIKPLYYYNKSDVIAFSSELLPLARFFKPKINIEACQQFLTYGYTFPPETIYENIYELQPGEKLTWKSGTLNSNNFSIHHSNLINSDKTYQNLLESDVEVGTFLSGGLDSAIITYEINKIHNKKLKTFSIGFEDPSFDESRFSKSLSQFLNTEHFELILSETQIEREIMSIVSKLQSPLADYSFIPTYFLAQLAASEVKVVISGDGADELYGGYPTYNASLIANTISNIPLSKNIFNFAEGLLKKIPDRDDYMNSIWKAKKFINHWSSKPMERHFTWMSYGNLDKNHVFLDYLSDFDKDSPLAWDLHTYLPCSVLKKVDLAAMAHSLEVRPGFLTKFHLGQSSSLNRNEKFNLFQNKIFLKNFYRNKLPKEIIHRSKHGFSVPLYKWSKTILKDKLIEILKNRQFLESVGLNIEFGSEIYKYHFRKNQDYSRILWSLLVLQNFTERAKI